MYNAGQAIHKRREICFPIEVSESRTRNGVFDRTSFVTVPDFIGPAEIAYNEVVLECCILRRRARGNSTLLFCRLRSKSLNL